MSQHSFTLKNRDSSVILNHCLGTSLGPYVASKLPLDLVTKPKSRVVVGFSSNEVIFRDRVSRKKQGKLFNCYRPVARLSEGEDGCVVELTCFPGRDYVEHYAALAQTHYLLQEKRSFGVSYIEPSDHEIAQIIMNSNLVLMGVVDVVVLGYVEQLNHLATKSWQWGGTDLEGLIGWQIHTGSDGRRVALVGARFSFWGDISYHLVCALCKLNSARCIIYIGKAGSLRKYDHPNEVIATGSESYLNGEKISWKNVLEPAVQALCISNIEHGIHVTVRSPLDESEKWLSQWMTKSDWVDCEVGWMARSCQENGADFAYLHIISDNVAKEYEENLASESTEPCPTKRKHLLQQIQKVLCRYLHLDGP